MSATDGLDPRQATIPTPENQYAAWAQSTALRDPEAETDTIAYRTWCQRQMPNAASAWIYKKRDTAWRKALRLADEADAGGNALEAPIDLHRRAAQAQAFGNWVNGKIEAIEVQR